MIYNINTSQLPYTDKIIHVAAMNDGVGIIYEFENGYQASVVCHSQSYGGDEGLIEIAAMRNKKIVNIGLARNDSVVGWLEYRSASRIMKIIHDYALAMLEPDPSLASGVSESLR